MRFLISYKSRTCYLLLLLKLPLVTDLYNFKEVISGNLGVSKPFNHKRLHIFIYGMLISLLT